MPVRATELEGEDDPGDFGFVMKRHALAGDLMFGMRHAQEIFVGARVVQAVVYSKAYVHFRYALPATNIIDLAREPK